jgi:type I restriction enzyme S subunit
MSLLDEQMASDRGWARVGDFYEVTRKPRGLDVTSVESIPFAAMDAIPQGGAYAPAFTMKSRASIASGTYFERGDILVAKITPSFENGKQAFVQTLPQPFGYATTEVIPLHPRDENHDPRLLFFYLLHPDIRHYVAERMEGSTGRQRVPEKVLLDLPMPHIEGETQAAMADVLETIRIAVEAEIARERIASMLKQASLQALYTRGTRNEAQKESAIGLVPESWITASLGSLGRVGNGSTPKRSIGEYWVGGTYPWLTSAKVYDREIVSSDQFVTSTALKQCHLPQLSPGAILIAITGQGKTLGHCAVLAMNATINQHLAYVATDLTRAEPSFVRGYLETQYDFLRQVGAGGGSTKGALTCAFLRVLPIPLPPLEEQRRIAGILNAIDLKIDLHRRKRAALEQLFEALLHNLVTGKIRVADLDLAALTRKPATVRETAA